MMNVVVRENFELNLIDSFCVEVHIHHHDQNRFDRSNEYHRSQKQTKTKGHCLN